MGLDGDSTSLKNLQYFYSKPSDAKAKVGISVEPQMNNTTECNEFPRSLQVAKVLENFLDNHKIENYVQLTNTLVDTGIHNVTHSPSF